MLYLASRSLCRRQLLQRLDIPFQVIDLEIPEVRREDELPQDYVRRVAQEKAQVGLARVRDAFAPKVLGADTEVVLDGRVFGKPADLVEAAAMLAALSGRTHQVMTAVSLVAAGGVAAQVLVVSEVSFALLSQGQIARYVDSGEPMGKAGAYAIQGRGECFVSCLVGSYSGVMGLPLQQTAQLLATFEES
ncbi:MAG TPA: Maf-like protein [Xylella fastidiosa subsp. multiplex]